MEYLKLIGLILLGVFVWCSGQYKAPLVILGAGDKGVAIGKSLLELRKEKAFIQNSVKRNSMEIHLWILREWC